MKAKFITFVRGLKNGTPPRFQSYLKSLTLLLVVVMSVNMWGADTWEKLTSVPKAGDVVILVNETAKREMTGITTSGTKYGIATTYSTSPAATYPLTVCAGNSDESLAFKTSDNKYLYWNSGNSLEVNTTLDNKTSWTVTVSNGNFTITNVATNTRVIKYNKNSGQERFACYTSGQEAIQLYKKKAAAPTFTITAKSNDESFGTVSLSGSVITASPNEGYGYATPAYTVNPAGSATVEQDGNEFTVTPSANTTVTINFAEKSYANIIWSVNGNTITGGSTKAYVGEKVSSLPEDPDAPATCSEKIFMGWTDAPVTDGNKPSVLFTKVSDAPEIAAAGTVTYYAVFATKGGTPITWTKMAASEISESGTYALITSSGNAFTGSITKGRGAYTTGTFSFTNNVASTAPDGTLELELTAYEDNEDYLFDIYNSTYGYLYIKAATEGNLAWSEDELTIHDYWIYDSDDSNFEFWHSPNDYYASLRVNSGTFRTYNYNSTTGSAIAFAKKNGGVTYSDYVTSCITPTYSVTIQSNDNTMGSVTVDPAITEDAYEAGTLFYVEATAEEGYRFVNWTISDNNEGASLSEAATETENIFTTGAADVTLTANFEEIPADPITVTLKVGEHGTLDCEDCENNTITEKTAGDGVLVPDVTANEGWAFLGWSTSSTATEAQYKPADADIFYPSDDNKTLYAVYAQLYKVTLRYTDEVKWQETAGGAITLPSRDCKNETYKGHFAGWSITEFAEETTNPATAPTIYAESITPTEDVILYPVFSVSTEGTQWVKKTGDQVTEGIYALITTDGHAFSGSISSGHGEVTTDAFAFTNNVATSAPTGTCEITMQTVTGGFKMYNADHKYLYATKAASGGLAWHDSENSYWKWASSNWMYNGVTNARIRDYNNTIRTYGANNGAVIQFAKKESVEENKYWSTPANDVTNPELDTPAGDYLSPLTVKITEASYDDDLMYYYTVDGTTPVAIGLVPQGTTQEYEPATGIVLEPAKTYNLKLIGYDVDGYTSQIASATYVLYPVFNSISDMYAGATTNKPVGLVLTNAYVHAVNTIGQNSQIFVQQGDLGVVLSVTTANIPEGVEAGKQISGTAVGTYTITNARPQISYFEFQSTFSVSDGTRPEPIKIDATTIDKVSTNLLGLVKLEGVYAQSEASNVIVVNSNAEGTGTSMNVYDFFNKVSTIPASDVKCNVIGLFNERQNNSDPIVYSVMPVLATDFDVVEKQDAQLPTVNPAGGASEGEALPVANEEVITITRVAGFTTTYSVNDGTPVDFATAAQKTFNVTDENTKLVVTATRPYYNDASATYYYYIDPSLTKYPITLPSPQTYVKTETDLASAKAGDKVTITISQKVARYWETSVTVVKTDEESVTTDVTSEGEHVYSFTMPAYPVTVKVTAQDAPKSVIYYNKGGIGIEGEMSQESVYIGDEYTLKDCAFHAAGLTFAGWKAYKTSDESTPVTITDNKIIVPDYNVSVKATWDEATWHKDGTWELIEDASDLKVGDYVILASSINATAIGTFNVPGNGKSYYSPVDVTKSDDKKKITDRKTALVMYVEAGTKENTFAFRIEENSKYLAAISSADNIIGNIDTKTDETSWSVTNKEAGVSYNIVAQGTYTRNLLKEYTSGSARITCYGSTSSGVTELAIYKFYPKAWTVTFDDNVEDEEIAVPKMQRADPTTNKVTISTMVPQRTGYDFLKWNSAKGGTGELTADPGDEITLSANKTLYAQWSIKQYNVAVAEVENVTINAKPYGEADITEGTNADVNFKKSVVLTYSELNEDYVFKSWKVTKADDETVEVPLSVGSSTTFEVPAYAVTVSAVIESKATTQLTVTYHANGGVNKTPEGPEEVNEQVNWNTTIKFAEHPCPFEKNLCTFAGWNTKADGTGTTYKTQVTVKTDIDLYAMWEASAVEYVLDAKETTKVKVQEGVAPAGSAATFVTTYTGTFGQLTDTHKGTLTLTGYAGKVITGVKMQMKSNASSGAGTIIIKVGDKEICSTSYEESFGSHSNSYSVAELQNFNAAIIGEAENITIVVSCTDNSLYINGYTIEYTDPEIIRNELTAEQYTTFCWPKTIPANAYTGATFWNIENKTTMADGRLSSITIVQHEGDLEAGVPYIMYNTATEFKCYQTGDAVEEPAADGNNGLVGVFETTMFDNFSGDAATIDALAAARGIYIISDGTLYLCGNNCGVYANRAYILNSAIEDLSAQTPPAAPRRVIGNPNVAPTNLNGLNSNMTATKVLRDGQFYILRDTKIYNAQGQFVK